MVDTLALVLMILGALNWLLVGVFQFDLVAWIMGSSDAALARIVYSLIGLAGLWGISFLFRRKKRAAEEMARMNEND